MPTHATSDNNYLCSTSSSKISEKFVTKDLQRHLLESASRVPIKQYFRDKLGWSSQVFDDIQWDLQSKVLVGYDSNDLR
jgi:hypothetical protein